MTNGVDNGAPSHPAGAAPGSTGQRRGRVVRLLVWLLSGEFKGLALGVFFVGFGLSELARQELSILCWRQTQGTVIDSHTEWLERTKGGFGPSITVRVRFRYTVDGREYESARVTTGEPILFYTVQEAAEFRKRFSPGGAVRVLYAPYAPSEATLIASRSSGPWILLGFGGPLLLLAAYRRWRRRRDGEEAHPDVDIPLHGV